MLTMQYIDLRVFQNKVTQITLMFVFLEVCVHLVAVAADETTSHAHWICPKIKIWSLFGTL